MASTRTTTRTIRITNEVAEFFKKKPLNRAVEDLYELIRRGDIKFDGENLKVECTHQNEKNQVKNSEKTAECTHQTDEKVYTPSKTAMESVDEMANLMRVPTEKLLDDIKELLEEGTLYYSNGKLVNPRYEEFERLCEVKKQDADKMINNVVRQMGG